ncbi:hypothetical protein UFOVP250_43 [uncultured Caudovirales phage]|uniref:Uncharacterized protein n=1 Tax=uncultured Caudovirales phage TaxID=2100421 RepID=A0A6J5LHT9_9CAUD|nr:hypothetical protein UFOVP250_43 [uncultured Caudovirales phage]
MHNDKHVIKMILESAQLLSTAHRVLDGTESIVKSKTNRNVKRWVLPDDRDTVLYSATHMNHPSAIWCRQSRANYNWLVSLFDKLCKEYTYRYGKTHKCESMFDTLKHGPYNIPVTKPFTEPTPAMPKEVIVEGNSIASYRNYYISNKQHLASWSGKINSRNVPEWFNYAN